jgi:diacylglycerol kinase family enzyme
MHVYIYDSFLNHKKYDGVLARIETRLTDLGLNGKIARMGAMKNIQSAVENELKRGAKTIIAVGDDQTVNQVIGAMAKFNQTGSLSLGEKNTIRQSVPLGIIPIGKDNHFIAESLGVSREEEACDILSGRRIEKLDLGQANDSFFLSSASITNGGTVIEMDKTYSIEILDEGEVNVVNLATSRKPKPANVKFNPQDGTLELFIRTEKKRGFLKFAGAETGESIFSLKKLTIHNNKNRPLILDGSLEVPTPARINAIKQKLNVIVGKNRNF